LVLVQVLAEHKLVVDNRQELLTAHNIQEEEEVVVASIVEWLLALLQGHIVVDN
jgi:hypothetical protein